jgi:predicted nucleotidyltransferase
MIKLKEYVDFITSLVEMDEVKNSTFILPTHMDFMLEMMNHREIHKEVRKLKEQEIVGDDLVEPFEIDILGITIKFEHEGYES